MPQPVVCTIYHNPGCTKSRATLALLRERGVEPVVVEYLRDSPTAAALQAIVRKLGLRAKQIVRQNEELYIKEWADRDLTEAQWLEVLAKNPLLIERPIVVLGERAAIGRPPENVLSLFEFSK